MSYTVIVLFTLSILIPAVIGLVRFKKINSIYHPFLYLIWLGCFNELLSLTLIKFYFFNTITNNIYYLLEALLIFWQFKRWNLFHSYKKLFSLLVFLISIAWVINCFIVSKINVVASYYIIIYSFVIVLMSINMVNALLIREKRQLLKNPIFLICISFIIFYTYATLVEIFFIYGLTSSSEFRINIYHILSYFNLFSNLIYAIAILWMPRKQEFILP